VRKVDDLVVGQGLAGTCLAWELLARGRSVGVVDRGEPMTASKISAGLLNPIIGRNFNLSWRFGQTIECAVRFYRERERELGASFLRSCRLVRLFRETREREVFERKRAEGLYRGLLSDPQPDPLVPPGVRNDQGGFEIARSGSVETAAFLAASRRHFEGLGCFIEGDCRPGELEVSGGRVRWRDLEAGHAILCRGFRGAGDPHFPWVPFRPAKGEILEVAIEGLADDRILNRGNWLFPTAGGRWRTGTTYSWDPLDTVPTEEARSVIEARLRGLLPAGRWSVITHQAAVRPIVNGRKPVLGRHPDDPALVLFNGLGSKGALHAPWCAARLADHLLDGAPLDPEVDLARRFPRPPGPGKAPGC